MPREAAIKAVGIILSCFPSANRDGIENYYKMASESLSEFPDEILQKLCDPKTGIVTTSTFLPSISELRAFCHREWDKLTPRRVDDQAEEAKRLYGPADVETLEEREARRAIIKQKFKQLLADLELATAMNSMRK
jgi:hypothetical protein